MKDLLIDNPFLEFLKGNKKAVLIVPKKGNSFALRISKTNIMLQEQHCNKHVVTIFRYDFNELSQSNKVLDKSHLPSFTQTLSNIYKTMKENNTEIFFITEGKKE